VRYQWVQSDWNAGNLVVGSHRMEAEVISGSNRQTYPNNDPSGYGQPYLALVVYEDLEQGA
jgi:hypothetical protein